MWMVIRYAIIRQCSCGADLKNSVVRKTMRKMGVRHAMQSALQWEEAVSAQMELMQVSFQLPPYTCRLIHSVTYVWLQDGSIVLHHVRGTSDKDNYRLWRSRGYTLFTDTRAGACGWTVFPVSILFSGRQIVSCPCDGCPWAMICGAGDYLMNLGVTFAPHSHLC